MGYSKSEIRCLKKLIFHTARYYKKSLNVIRVNPDFLSGFTLIF